MAGTLLSVQKPNRLWGAKSERRVTSDALHATLQPAANIDNCDTALELQRAERVCGDFCCCFYLHASAVSGRHSAGI